MSFPRRFSLASLPVSLTVLCLGIALRLWHWIQNRPLGIDEAFTATALFRAESFAELLPPDVVKIAPFAYIGLLEIVSWFWTSEMALRLLPLIYAILGLLLWRRLLECDSRIGAPVRTLALTLLCLSPIAIFFSAEVKHYTLDILVSLTVVAALWRWWDLPSSQRSLFGLCLVGLVAPWFSFVSIFVLVPGLVLVFWETRSKGPGNWMRLIPVGLFSAGSFLLVYFIVIQPWSMLGGLHRYWDGGYPPFPPTTTSEVWDGLKVFINAFRNPGGFRLALLACILFCLGASQLRSRLHCLSLLVVLTCFTASWFRWYPFQTRVILFLSPFLFLLIAEGIHFSARRLQTLWSVPTPVTWVLLLGFLFFEPGIELGKMGLGGSLDNWGNAPLPRDVPMAQLIEHYQRESKGEQVIYLGYRTQVRFAYYTKRMGLKPPLFYGSNSFETALEQVDRFKGFRRAWFLLSRSPGDLPHVKKLVAKLNRMGTRIETRMGAQSALMLYDLS